MRISHFTFSLDVSKGGVPAGVLMTAKQLTRYGFSNQVISTGNTVDQLERNSSNIAELKAIGVEFNYSLSRFQNNYGLGSFRNLMKTITAMPKPDLIVLHQIYTFSTILGYWYAKKFQIPYAVKPHGSLTKYHESDSRFIKFLAKKMIISRILLDSDAIIVTCESEKADLSFALQSKAFNLPYGSFSPNQQDENHTFLQPAIQNLRIVFSGRFDKKKNLPLLIKSLPRVLDRYPELILDIAGSGSENEVTDLHQLVSSLQLEPSIQFHGWIGPERMRQLLSASKLLVLPSKNENFAIVVAEALSLGIPCVVSKFVGTADIVAKHLAGEVIDELTPTSIADGIIKVLQGDGAAYRKAAIEATRDELDWSKIALQWKALVTSLAYTKD
jgi:glycosyltransferase involved in cell wall biosynthesis